MDRHVHTDLYSKGITDIFSVVSLLHSKYDPSSTWTVTYTLICIPRKAVSYFFDFENHKWSFQLDVGGGGGMGGGREEGDRDDLKFLPFKLNFVWCSIGWHNDSGQWSSVRKSSRIIWYFRLMTGRLWVTTNVCKPPRQHKYSHYCT